MGQVMGSRKTILVPRIQLCPSNPTFSLQNLQRTIPDQNRFHHDNKDQGQTLKHDGICPPSPAVSDGHNYLVFSIFPSIDTIVVAVTEGHRKLCKMIN